MAEYKLGDSMRVWLIEFRQQAEFAGVENMNECIRIIGRFMPTVIRNWITTVPIEVKQSWLLFAEALNHQFGKNSLEESREIKGQLKKLKQAKNETIKLHSAKWKHLRSLLQDNEIDETSQKIFYIQSLYHDSVRNLLADSTTVDIDAIILLSIQITDNAGLELGVKLMPADPILATNSGVNSGPEPMEIDHIGKGKQRGNSNWKFSKKYINKQNKFDVPRLYDKQGRPVCGHCQELHRNIDCKKKKEQQVNSVEVERNSVNLDTPTIRSVNHIEAYSAVNLTQQQRSSDKTNPISDLMYNGMKVSVLWDTGAQMDCMSLKLAGQFNLPIDKSKAQYYSNVDNLSM